MKKLILGASIFGLLCNGMVSANENIKSEDNPAFKPYRTAVKDLMKSLKKELQGAMKAGGPINALGVCNEKAMPITEEFSKKYGWEISRSSLKLRNAKNKPKTDAEQKHLETSISAGTEIIDVVEKDGKKMNLYMKPIAITNEVCLKCHGQNINPKVQAKISELYPEDKATNYINGDIRGAFVIYSPITEK
jgi:hypothetical protein